MSQQPRVLPIADIELVVFDWDGTVVDSTLTIAEAIRAACQDIGLPVPSLEDASYVIGLGLQDALRRVAPDIRPDQVEPLSDRFRHHYLARDRFLTPFPGMLDLFQALQGLGMPLAVATGKSRAGLERALDATQTRSCFAMTRCADESVPKPGPEMVYELCEGLNLAPERVLVVGDTTHDILMAHNAGARAIAVSYGAHPPATLHTERPLAIVESVRQLHDLLITGLRPSASPGQA